MDLVTHAHDSIGEWARDPAPAGFIAETPLVLGSTNLYQDLHFGALYLEASLRKNTQPEYPGYSFVIAIYEGGIERYYVAAQEARETAEWIIRRVESHPEWLAGHLRAIETLSRNLDRVFPSDLGESVLRRSSWDRLRSFYLRHHRAQSELYRHARIPEAMDRGEPHFTNYLHAKLAGAGIPEAERLHVFEYLTRTTARSVYMEEQAELDAITQQLRELSPEALDSHTPEMLINPRIRERLRRHRSKWGYLTYHGYRSPSLATEKDYLVRIKASVGQKAEWRTSVAPTQRPHLGARSLPISDTDRQLFSLYGEIGRVKLQRRYHQLRSFYFFDQLLREIARRLDISEWHLRCALPSEVLAAIRTGRMPAAIADRQARCAVIHSAGNPEVIVGDDLSTLASDMKLAGLRQTSLVERRGTVACTGFVRGPALVIGTRHPNEVQMQGGEVLVCEAADPDLLPLLRRAAALVTEQGGVTSHASVLCRELDIPTLIGVESALSFASDGDELEVDAFRGVLRRVGPSASTKPSPLLVPRQTWDDPAAVGSKAALLERARLRGINVPPFLLLDWQAMTTAFDAQPQALLEELDRMATALPPLPGNPSRFMLRSSGRDENQSIHLTSGKYRSVGLSFEDGSLDAISDFISSNLEKGYEGAVILQRQVPAAYCGVTMGAADRAMFAADLVTEFVLGPRNSVTEGTSRPMRFLLNREAGELIEECQSASSHILWRDGLVDWLTRVERTFGQPIYVEWGRYHNTFWLYQLGEGSDPLGHAHGSWDCGCLGKRMPL